MRKLTLLLLTAASMTLSGCLGTLSSFVKPTAPSECLQRARPLPEPKDYPLESKWQAKVTQQYVETAKNLNCLIDKFDPEEPDENE